MSRKLWEISGELSQARDELMRMDLPEEMVADTLAAIEMEFNEKAIATAAAIRKIETEAAGCLAVIAEMQKDLDSMKAHPKRLKARSEYLRSYLANAMLQQDVLKIESETTPPISIVRRKNIQLIDEAIPQEYIAIILKVDRAAAKAAAKLDPSVNWAIEVDAPYLKV